MSGGGPDSIEERQLTQATHALHLATGESPSAGGRQKEAEYFCLHSSSVTSADSAKAITSDHWLSARPDFEQVGKWSGDDGALEERKKMGCGDENLVSANI